MVKLNFNYPSNTIITAMKRGQSAEFNVEAASLGAVSRGELI